MDGVWVWCLFDGGGMGGTGAGIVIGASRLFDGEGLRWPLGRHTCSMKGGVGIIIVRILHV